MNSAGCTNLFASNRLAPCSKRPRCLASAVDHATTRGAAAIAWTPRKDTAGIIEMAMMIPTLIRDVATFANDQV